MDIRIRGYYFREVKEISDKLVYSAHGNIYKVSFNIHNRPRITRTLRTNTYVDIPEDVLEEFYWQIWENYPSGFCSRDKKNSDWIISRFSEITEGSVFKIDEPLDACGGLMINDNYLDAYVITLSLIDNPSFIPPQECIISANFSQRKIYLFRYFAEKEDFGNYKPNQILKICYGDKLSKIGVDKKSQLVFFDDIVAVTVYSYDDYNRLTKSEVAIRNDKFGKDINSTLGTYILTGGIEYLE